MSKFDPNDEFCPVKVESKVHFGVNKMQEHFRVARRQWSPSINDHILPTEAEGTAAMNLGSRSKEQQSQTM